MKAFCKFILSPSESNFGEKKVSEVIMLIVLYMIVTFLMGFGTIFIARIISQYDIPQAEAIADYPWYIIAFIAPLVEEISFRLPLRRTRLNLTCWIFVFSYFVIGKCIGNSIYSIDLLYVKIPIAMSFAMLTYWKLYKYIAKMDFKLFFYLMAVTFGVLHLFNFDYSNMFIEFGSIFYLVSYVLNKTIGGLFFGFFRIKYGFLFGLVFHIALNSLTFI